MVNISIVYYSGSGHTAKLAEAVDKGAASIPEVKTRLIPINDEDIVNGRYKNDDVIALLDSSDAIIFGSPTYMGGPAAQFKAFADATVGSWWSQKWRDKLSAGFTVSGTPSGDKFNTLQYFHTLAMEHGMIWVSLGEMPMQPNGVNRLGSWGGAMAQANQEPTDVAPNAEDKLTGQLLGRRVATFALKHSNSPA
jgi:NAD(P)H dehydrogenase (quinone)